MFTRLAAAWRHEPQRGVAAIPQRSAAVAPSQKASLSSDFAPPGRIPSIRCDLVYIDQFGPDRV
jgi:hypothetical protein